MKLEKALSAIIFVDFFITSMGANAGDTLIPWTSLQAGQSITSNSGKYRLILQNDGNLVYYRNTDGSVRWNTGTNSGTSAPMQTDGNFVLYNQGGAPIWNSATSGYPGASISAQNVR
jgi:arylamine N-acetyltransferase